MRHLVHTLVATSTLVLATACALLVPAGLDGKARQAAALTLETYAVLQQAVLVYGRLPPCDGANRVHLCREPQSWHRLRDAERRASHAIAAAAPVLNGDMMDTGELVRALEAIDAVARALADTRRPSEVAP